MAIAQDRQPASGTFENPIDLTTLDSDPEETGSEIIDLTYEDSEPDQEPEVIDLTLDSDPEINGA